MITLFAAVLLTTPYDRALVNISAALGKPESRVAARCYALDGDTIRCGRETIRLSGIDAPELPGHCRTGRICAPGDPFVSKASLTGFLRSPGNTYIRRVGKDRYGRTLGIVTLGGRNASCWQLRGNAIYVRKWDTGGYIRRACPAATVRVSFGERG